MNTQSFLFENSAELPEGLYLQLMNKLKLDFENPPVELKIICIDNNVPSTVVIRKKELKENIIKASIDWPDREEILLKLITMSVVDLKALCFKAKLPTMKANPRYIKQTQIVADLRKTHATAWSQRTHM